MTGCAEFVTGEITVLEEASSELEIVYGKVHHGFVDAEPLSAASVGTGAASGAAPGAPLAAAGVVCTDPAAGNTEYLSIQTASGYLLKVCDAVVCLGSDSKERTGCSCCSRKRFLSSRNLLVADELGRPADWELPWAERLNQTR